jgi:hypothetical protein
MNTGYYAKGTLPYTNLPQVKSDCEQRPFYFGGSQIPINLAGFKKVHITSFKKKK